MGIRDTYSAAEVMHKINKLRAQGKTEEEIAVEFGFTNRGKANIRMFRDYLRMQSEQARNERSEEVSRLMENGYSLQEAADKLRISYSEARTLRLWYLNNKGE